MTTTEALAELRAAGYSKASIWSAPRVGGLVAIYLNDGTRGEIWCRPISNTVSADKIWAAIHKLITRK